MSLSDIPALTGSPETRLPEERRRLILEKLAADGRVSASELCGFLRVSEDTVRRDLRDLDEAGLLQRVHGGALPRPPGAVPFADRAARGDPARSALARRAAGLIEPGQVVVIDGGTTTLELARCLAPDLRATVVTTSPPLALALAGHSGIDTILIGGRLHRDAMVTVGADSVDALRQIRADLCLLGVCSLDPVAGITTVYADEVATKRAMIAGAARTVALVSADKLGTASPFVVAPADRLAVVVTEAGIADADLAPYRSLGIRILAP
jgi:DeoR/GlpR family transcriptional regulator of sugar metabolism